MLGTFFKLSCQQIQWGRDRHKKFWNSWGYNFASFKGMLLKLIQATILDSRNILDKAFLWLPVRWPSSGQLKNHNSQTFLLQKYVTWNCDTLQKYSVHKIEELVHLNSQISFCDVTTNYNPNCLFGQESTNPKNEEFETITYDKYKSESLNSLSFIV